MEGAARAESRRLDVALFTAWHTALFGLNGYANKGKMAGGKSLADLLSSGRAAEPADSTAALLNLAHELKAKGKFVKITRLH